MFGKEKLVQQEAAVLSPFQPQETQTFALGKKKKRGIAGGTAEGVGDIRKSISNFVDKLRSKATELHKESVRAAGTSVALAALSAAFMELSERLQTTSEAINEAAGRLEEILPVLDEVEAVLREIDSGINSDVDSLNDLKDRVSRIGA